ncbi:unnamed protein product [Paramecium octaurelia]|uniref:Uncharacterized protein n=1 Tax=Paramecium octaurelia TaxID=43137 RepID=A0A8S1SIY6_PAROT|nr:unnamed protein product [Paramecium octaurelia]
MTRKDYFEYKRVQCNEVFFCCGKLNKCDFIMSSYQNKIIYNKSQLVQKCLFMSNTGSTNTTGFKLKNILMNYESITKPYRFYLNNEQQIINVYIELPPETELIYAISRVLQIASANNPLDQNPQNYELYIAQKNGQPQTDYPSFETDLRLEQTDNFTFSLVHMTFNNKYTKRKSTHDYSNQYSYSPLKQKKQSKDIDDIKKGKNCIFRFLGC